MNGEIKVGDRVKITNSKTGGVGIVKGIVIDSKDSRLTDYIVEWPEIDGDCSHLRPEIQAVNTANGN